MRWLLKPLLSPAQLVALWVSDKVWDHEGAIAGLICSIVLFVIIAYIEEQYP